jgi:antitoxin component of RelBE/YafQ-DinJ toxin-antitoxin module
MSVAQITAKVNPTLKKEFMKKAQDYDLPASGVLSILMRMFVAGDILPTFKVKSDDDMLSVHEPIDKVIAALERMQ